MSAPTTGQPAGIPDHLPAIASPIGPAVDVLAGEQRITRTEYTPGVVPTIVDTYWLIPDDARAAVAELIEADREYDAASGRLNLSADCDEAFRRRLYEQFVAVIERRRAALARVGGAA